MKRIIVVILVYFWLIFKCYKVFELLKGNYDLSLFSVFI